MFLFYPMHMLTRFPLELHQQSCHSPFSTKTSAGDIQLHSKAINLYREVAEDLVLPPFLEFVHLFLLKLRRKM